MDSRDLFFFFFYVSSQADSKSGSLGPNLCSSVSCLLAKDHPVLRENCGYACLIQNTLLNNYKLKLYYAWQRAQNFSLFDSWSDVSLFFLLSLGYFCFFILSKGVVRSKIKNIFNMNTKPEHAVSVEKCTFQKKLKLYIDK